MTDTKKTNEAPKGPSDSKAMLGKRPSFAALFGEAKARRGIRIAKTLLHNCAGDDDFLEAARVVLEYSLPDESFGKVPTTKE